MATHENRVEIQNSTMESDWPQHDRPTACVFAQRYSPITFVSLRFHCLKREVQRVFKNVI
jgi:hypothetical protein